MSERLDDASTDDASTDDVLVDPPVDPVLDRGLDDRWDDDPDDDADRELAPAWSPNGDGDATMSEVGAPASPVERVFRRIFRRPSGRSARGPPAGSCSTS
jgi:hypothetical protein